jgi:hypothetical protein
MLAYKVTEENLPYIAANNDGVRPPIENEETFFISDPDVPDRIITKAVFEKEYRIRIAINEIGGRYAVDKN